MIEVEYRAWEEWEEQLSAGWRRANKRLYQERLARREGRSRRVRLADGSMVRRTVWNLRIIPVDPLTHEPATLGGEVRVGRDRVHVRIYDGIWQEVARGKWHGARP